MFSLSRKQRASRSSWHYRHRCWPSRGVARDWTKVCREFVWPRNTSIFSERREPLRDGRGDLPPLSGLGRLNGGPANLSSVHSIVCSRPTLLLRRAVFPLKDN